MVSLAIDITERLRLEAEIRQLALYDSLTGLPNRRLFEDRLQLAVASARRSGGHLALLFLDLDDFKPVNDGHGHEVGDQLLQQVARRLSTCMRASDALARLGGDEFFALIGPLATDRIIAHAQALRFARELRRCLMLPYQLQLPDQLQLEPQGQTIPRQTIEHQCSASIGLSVGVGDCEPGELLRAADKAMYCAKSAGKNRIAFTTRSGKPTLDLEPEAPTARRA